ncbi:MlaD family protein [Longimicrobium sp.]|uniref:MlaD family protein n=1 Tax=Longimicrobium sp. TaxID=2029185 RepID=UPI002E30E831|nr:MlaD family protein [Longimicrobium sp.]HEX6041096.1 MlaD family protein [Longimicrobium sp.]
MAPVRTPRREVHVGIFVVVGILAVLAALFALTDPGTFRGRYYVSTVVQDAGGIRKGDPVQMKGVNIGRIRDFVIDGSGVRITMELQHDPGYKVPADSRVSIVSGGILQSMVAEIIPGSSKAELQDGAMLPSADSPTLTGTVETLGANADTVLIRAQQLLNQQTISAVGASAQQMQQLLVQLTQLATDQRSQLNALTSSLQRSAQGLEGTVAAVNQPELARAIARTDSMSIRLDAATGSLQQASQSLATLMQRVDSGEGTLGRLTRDDELYQNMNAAVTSLNQLTTDIRQNPRKYINVSVF